MSTSLVSSSRSVGAILAQPAFIFYYLSWIKHWHRWRRIFSGIFWKADGAEKKKLSHLRSADADSTNPTFCIKQGMGFTSEIFIL